MKKHVMNKFIKGEATIADNNNINIDQHHHQHHQHHHQHSPTSTTSSSSSSSSSADSTPTTSPTLLISSSYSLAPLNPYSPAHYLLGETAESLSGALPDQSSFCAAAGPIDDGDDDIHRPTNHPHFINTDHTVDQLLNFNSGRHLLDATASTPPTTTPATGASASLESAFGFRLDNILGGCFGPPPNSPFFPGGSSPFFPGFTAAAAAAHNPIISNNTISTTAGSLMVDNNRRHRVVLPAQTSSVQNKAIPNDEDLKSFDFGHFKTKDPETWGMEDVVAWMFSVARKHKIRPEDLNVLQFGSCSGPLLTGMTQRDFLTYDRIYGSILFTEFQKLRNESRRKNSSTSTATSSGIESSRVNERPSTANNQNSYNNNNNNYNNNFMIGDKSFDDLLAQFGLNPTAGKHHSHNLIPPTSSSSSSTSSSLSNNHFSNHNHAHQQQQSSSSSSTSTNNNHQIINGTSNHHQLNKKDQQQQSVVSSSTVCQSKHSKHTSAEPISAGLHPKLAKITKLNKDGTPRKRSQHTKGTKLWMFIRDALKDPKTCPSIVKWEDESEGVFRIVESERLARLWGEQKNNGNMTYEKLSRAMRYYYCSKILLPVIGRRLVYKFGPNAYNWKRQRVMAAIAAAETDGQSLGDTPRTEFHLLQQPVGGGDNNMTCSSSNSDMGSSPMSSASSSEPSTSMISDRNNNNSSSNDIHSTHQEKRQHPNNIRHQQQPTTGMPKSDNNSIFMPSAAFM